MSNGRNGTKPPPIWPKGVLYLGRIQMVMDGGETILLEMGGPGEIHTSPDGWQKTFMQLMGGYAGAILEKMEERLRDPGVRIGAFQADAPSATYVAMEKVKIDCPQHGAQPVVGTKTGIRCARCQDQEVENLR